LSKTASLETFLVNKKFFGAKSVEATKKKINSMNKKEKLISLSKKPERNEDLKSEMVKEL